MPACSYVNPLGSPAPLLSTPAHRQSSSGSAGRLGQKGGGRLDLIFRCCCLKAFTLSPLLTPVPRRSNADCDKIDAKPRRCSPPFACPGAGNKSAKSRCGGGWLGATAQEMTLLNQEYAAVPGELKRSCCSERARVAAVPPCAEEMVVFRASCSFFSPLPAPLTHCKAIS